MLFFFLTMRQIPPIFLYQSSNSAVTFTAKTNSARMNQKHHLQQRNSKVEKMQATQIG